MAKRVVFAMVLALMVTIAVTAMAAEIIVPGDMISIVVAGEPEFTRTVIVGSDGSVGLGKAGQVALAGLTPVDAAGKVAGALSEYVKSAQVTVSIVTPAPRTAVITGQVAKPGPYAVTTTTRLKDLLEMAGGPTADADLSRVVVTRKYGKAGLISADLAGFQKGTDPEGNPEIGPDDSVLVPARVMEGGSVYAVGEVRLKGPVSFREGITVRDVLAAAGGPTENGDVTKITISRQGQPDKVVDYDMVLAGDPAANLTLQKGDSVFVPTAETKGSYVVRGAVNAPGAREVRGVTRLTDAIAAAGGVTSKADTNRVKITSGTGKKKQTTDHNLEEIKAGRAPDPGIGPGDVVDVPRKGTTSSPSRLALALVGMFLLISR